MSSASRRVVFVDDDPLVLRSIRRLMTRRLETCDLVFAGSGDEALELMQGSDVDIIVTDLNMDQMDGATLLQRVQDNAPEVVRIVLSGSCRLEEGAVTRVAHQCVAKPFNGKLLGTTLMRALALRELLEDVTLRKLVAGRNELPSVPAVYLDLLEALDRETTSITRVVSLVQQDPGLAARILQLASSAFLGRVVPPRSIRDAVVFLGFKAIKAFVLTHRIVEMYRPSIPGLSIDAIQDHALRTGALARDIVGESAGAEKVFMAGMLHGLGRLVLAGRFPRRYAAVLRAAAAEELPLAKVERDMLGASHAEVGAYLLGLWGIDPDVVEAVARCQTPSRIAEGGLPSALYLASRLAADPESPVGDHGDDDPGIDAELVARIAAAPDLQTWRLKAAHVPQSGQA